MPPLDELLNKRQRTTAGEQACESKWVLKEVVFVLQAGSLQQACWAAGVAHASPLQVCRALGCVGTSPVSTWCTGSLLVVCTALWWL